MKNFVEKLKNNDYIKNFLESFVSVLPIDLCVIVFYLTGLIHEDVNATFYLNAALTETVSVSFDLNSLWFFLGLSLVAVIGLTLFQIGVDKSMQRMGTLVGETSTRKKSMFLLVAMSFILGFLVTMAEPDLTVLAGQFGLPSVLVIVVVSTGTGIFLVIGVIRIILKKSLKIMFLAFYALVFALVALIDPSLLPLCFDAGGVAAGAVTVPFILGFGAGLAMSTGSKTSGEDSFGLSALCSTGPIIAVMIMSLFLGEDALSVYEVEIREFTGSALGATFVDSLSDVLLAFGPIIVFFLIYDFLFLKLSLKSLLKILVGLVYGFLGLWFFLTAVNAAFWPTALIVGGALGGGDSLWILLLVAAIFGLLGVIAEPAVQVLVKQVEEMSDGTVKSGVVLAVMAVGNALALLLAVLRVVYQFPIEYILIPGYILVFVLMLFSPNLYVYVAFDSGAVASGPMSSAFLLPYVIGAALANSEVTAEGVYEYAFGVVGLIAMMPLIVIEMMGAYINGKQKAKIKKIQRSFVGPDEEQIIHFGEAFS